MNKMIILAFALGAAAGSIGANLYLRNKYEAIVQEELESIRESAVRQGYQKAVAEHQADIRTVAGLTGDYDKEQAQVVFERDAEVDGEPIVVHDNPTEEPYLDGPECSEPYIISVDEYNETKLMNDKLELNFYEGDGSIVDERDDLVIDVMERIGADPMILFAEAQGEADVPPGVIYIRNDQTGADYEIQLNEGSWSDTIGFNRGGN